MSEPVYRLDCIRQVNMKRQIFVRIHKLLPLEAVALLSSSIKVRLEIERASGRCALSGDFAAEGRRSLQLGSDYFGVTAEVAGSGAVWRLIPKELGDGGMAATGGQMRDVAITT